ncbi:oxygenase MpaB family protein [Mucilaginibacter sp.]|uniref:oxygenase MpaB family protein n=1 Tax=Mucilaginibacter sp. TaxID=1882438 RepID=UPI0026238B79|nr:oxygenase MpaB family protein [Mucilaginibacter sp.]MDB4918986.1 hypothetical protein [Mucilaginibacter sp.]
MESLFVNKNSIVRAIWGKADTVLFIFAGAAAEFALNKAVDWLYYTGRLPKDPLGRLFSTVEYSHQIIFSEKEAALQAIDKITAIHKGVEKKRGAEIPDWAYLDVLFLLIDYSIRSFELLERKLTETEKVEIFHVFNRVGKRMQLAGLPSSYQEYCATRKEHLRQNLISSEFTIDLYRQYKHHLGTTRYIILKQVQLILVPHYVKKLLPVGNMAWIKPFLQLYKMLRLFKIEGFFKNALLPDTYKEQIRGLEAKR